MQSSNIIKYFDPESVLFWNESRASGVGGSKATPSFCILLQHSNRQQPAKTFKVVQPLISAAIFHRNLCQNMSQPKFQERIWLCITIPQISIACFDLLEKKSDKRGFNLLCDLLPPTATCGTFLAGSPQTRPSSSWLVLACHAECSSEVAQCRRSPTHLHGLQPFLESLKTDSQVPMNQEPP